jgi:hypothetical protein
MYGDLIYMRNEAKICAMQERELIWTYIGKRDLMI